MTLTFDGTVVVPVADPDDAERTARALASLLEPSATVLVVNVIEKGGGAIDKASVEQRQEYADEIFERARGQLEDAPGSTETNLLYGTDVVDTMFDAARDEDADAIVFIPRRGNRITELLTGDVSRRLVNEASVPVVSLPRNES